MIDYVDDSLSDEEDNDEEESSDVEEELEDIQLDELDDSDDFPEEPDEPEIDLSEIFTPKEIRKLYFSGTITTYVFAYDTDNESERRALGRLLSHRIGQILKKMGFDAKVARGQSNGVDIIVSLNSKILLVAEIKNYNIRTKIPDKIIRDCIKKLEEYPNCKRYLIYTQMANKKVLTQFAERGISVFEIGYQLMPKEFFNSIRPEYRTYRNVDSKFTSEDIKQKLCLLIYPIILENLDQLDVTINL